MISKRAVAEIPPLTLLPVQLATSVVALGAAVVAKRPTIRPTKELRQLVLLGMLNPGLAYALGIAGLAQITASMSVLLWATEPVLILLLAGWLLRERTSGILAVSLALALGGVILVISGRDVGGGLAGVALTMGGVAACAVYTILVKRWLLDDSTIAIVALQQSAALLFSLALLGGAAVLGLAHAMPRVSALAWVSAIGSGLVYYAAAFLALPGRTASRTGDDRRGFHQPRTALWDHLELFAAWRETQRPAVVRRAPDPVRCCCNCLGPRLRQAGSRR